MPPMRSLPGRRAILACLVAVFALLSIVPQPALALRVMYWNILNYPGTSGDTREDDYRTVVSLVQPDVVLIQELTSTTGGAEFLNDVLNTLEPGQWALVPVTNGTDTDNACFYKTSKVDYLSDIVLTTALRQIDGFIFRPDGYASSAAEFRTYTGHLKASTGSDNEQKRLAEVTILRNHLNALPTGSHFAFGGDFNIYSSSEPAWGKLTGSEADNDGRLFDPINRVGNWHDNASFADVHTQSTRTTSIGDGGATGGMDDRFDMVLMNDDMLDGEGIAWVTGSYTAVGQDGNHFNAAINAAPPNAAVTSGVANALYFASDHLPVYVDLQLPSMMIVAGALDFGRVMVGSSASLAVLVQNPAIAPADDLDYSMVASAGFTAPAGSFSVVAGGSGVPTIDMDTSTAAEHAGSISFNGDAPDAASQIVPATGTVLDHAVPSVSDLSELLAEAIDFGSHKETEFSDMGARVANFGYTSTQADLNVYDAVINGPDAARFSVVGFAATDVTGTPVDFVVHFDDVGATASQSYDATLSFSTRDEPGVVGATNLADLVYSLSAFVEPGGITSPEVATLTTRLLGNVPNPFNPRTTISFDLARASRVDLRIFDARGRLVRVLVQEERSQGRHDEIWDGRGRDGAAVASGVYHYRLIADGVTESRRMTLVR